MFLKRFGLVAVLVACMSVFAGSANAAVSGQQMPLGNLTDFKQTLFDDFSTDTPIGSFPGGAYGDRWVTYPDGIFDTWKVAKQYPSKVLHVDDDMLQWYFHSQNGYPLVATPVARGRGPGTDPYQGLKYGRFSVRVKSEVQATGFYPVFLLWPDADVWPQEGELNFPGGDLNAKIYGSVIRAQKPAHHDHFQTNARWYQWHTATIEWRPGNVRYYLDGKLIGHAKVKVPRTPMHWVLQVDSSDGYPRANPAAVANLQVDWISVWAYEPGTKPTIAPPAGEPITSSIPRFAAGRGGCRKSKARTVKGTVQVKFPSKSRKRSVTLGGKRIRSYNRINTTKLKNGTVKLTTAYTKNGKRVRGCHWLTIAN